MVQTTKYLSMMDVFPNVKPEVHLPAIYTCRRWDT